MAEKRNLTKWTPSIPIEPIAGLIILEELKVVSKIEKRLEKSNIKAPNKQELMKQIQQTIQTDDILSAYEVHPDQAIIVAITEKEGVELNLQVGDRVAYYGVSGAVYITIFNKKKYYAVRSSSILFRYLTDKS